MLKNPLLDSGFFILETLENSIFVSNTKEMNYNNILTESRNAITYITINRPKQLNALNAETITELNTAILAAEKDKLVRCIIITGAENKAFIAGADIKEFANYSKKEGEELARKGQELLCDLVENCGTPSIAAINGLAKILPSANHMILIAGGDGKGADFSPLSHPLAEHVSNVITFGKDGDKIANLAELVTTTNKVTTLTEAVQAAKASANNGDIVLLSPACASLDMFKNFAERGEQFMAAVTQMAEAS